MSEVVIIEKLVHGGQGIGTLADGRRVFVWNTLPGETVRIRITKKKRQLVEAIAEEIIDSSPDREIPRDAAYLSTSPWQMMTYEAENRYKQAILAETLQREHVSYKQPIAMAAGKNIWHYRNKMEYSFWADEGGLHLALFNRGSHQKQIIEGSSIAMPIIDQTAQAVLAVLNKRKIRGSQLKTVVLRASQNGHVAIALFVKDESFPEIPELQSLAAGATIYYSTPKSPASVVTKELYTYGSTQLTDTVLGTPITYDVNSFFQVNTEIFEQALGAIKTELGDDNSVDMYAGVGTIGIPVGSSRLVEIDKHNVAMAEHNTAGHPTQVVHAAAEQATDYISADSTLIVDPPRAGLHTKMIDAIIAVKPPKVLYLSCNPITQARDLALLQDHYVISAVTGYNFFPRTPHIESLAVLEAK